MGHLFQIRIYMRRYLILFSALLIGVASAQDLSASVQYVYERKDEAEEKRLFYVGITRARRVLVLSHATKRNINGRKLDMKPSPFLDLIPAELKTPLERADWKRKRKKHEQLYLFSDSTLR